MKKVIFLLGVFSTMYSYAQINTQSQVNTVIPNQNPFLDASGYINQDNSIAKGLGFPRTDLTTFVFNTSLLGNYQNFPTAFDGMIVYNIATGKTGANPATQGIQVDVEPGFYYFSNPEATEDTTDVSKGKWVRIGDLSTSKKVRGTFELTVGNNNAILTAMPDAANIKAIKSINIYRTDDNGNLQGGVVATTLYSYDEATKKAVFGTGVISTSLPKGTYAYVVEYE